MGWNHQLVNVTHFSPSNEDVWGLEVRNLHIQHQNPENKPKSPFK